MAKADSDVHSDEEELRRYVNWKMKNPHYSPWNERGEPVVAFNERQVHLGEELDKKGPENYFSSLVPEWSRDLFALSLEDIATAPRTDQRIKDIAEKGRAVNRIIIALTLILIGWLIYAIRSVYLSYEAGCQQNFVAARVITNCQPFDFVAIWPYVGVSIFLIIGFIVARSLSKPYRGQFKDAAIIVIDGKKFSRENKLESIPTFIPPHTVHPLEYKSGTESQIFKCPNCLGGKGWTVQKVVRCSSCEGQGRIFSSPTDTIQHYPYFCFDCKGSGKVTAEEQVKCNLCEQRGHFNRPSLIKQYNDDVSKLNGDIEQLLSQIPDKVYALNRLIADANPKIDAWNKLEVDWYAMTGVPE